MSEKFERCENRLDDDSRRVRRVWCNVKEQELDKKRIKSDNVDTEDKWSAINQAENMFEKKFFYGKKKWTLPPKESWFRDDIWEMDHDFICIKDELNKTKAKLDDKEIGSWRKHTAYTNRAGNVVSELKQVVRPELLTQAWCKFYEIVSTYPIIPKDADKPLIRSFHVCEAPGAFVTSLNHYLKLHHENKKWEWVANSLNPYYEGHSGECAITNDWFLLPTLDHWFFGSEGTGDIMSRQFLKDVQREFVNPNDQEGTFDLVTGDGSISCLDAPGEQEKIVCGIHYAEAVVALNVLARGGSLVIKKFTLLECESACLMYLFCCIFNEVHVFKPATSKSGNSEVYVVCLGYDGVHALKEYSTILGDRVCFREQKAMFPRDSIPKDFFRRHWQCCKLFKDLQVATILENIAWWETSIPEQQLKAVKDKVVELFLEKYQVLPIKRWSKVCRKLVHLQSNCLRMQSTGSFNDRQKQKNRTWSERLASIQEEVDKTFRSLFLDVALPEWKYMSKVSESILHKHTSNELEFRPTTGLPFEPINNSRFCYNPLVEMWNEFVQNATSIQDGCKVMASEYNWDRAKELICQCGQLQETTLVCHLESFAEADRKISFKLKECLSLASDIFPLSPDAERKSKTKPFDRCMFVVDAPLFSPYPVHLQEIRSKKVLLDEILCTLLSFTKNGDHLVVCLPSALTRFTAGLLYLLSAFFTWASCVPVMSTKHPGGFQLWMFVDFQHMLGTKAILDVLKAAAKRFEEIELSGTTVLELVPVPDLCRDPFFSLVFESNNAYLSSWLSNHVALEKEELTRH